MNKRDIEKYSSAITLSDMEVFVFPELMYSLVLANIMSPVIWAWRERDCFRKLKGKSSYRKLMRLKQFVMDEFEFNLDLETWGLTSKEKELKRFEKFIPPDNIASSNALFGYHGDKYYFDVDIRKHFGLDKYHDDIIPYWKTETVEAMEAFRLKPSYNRGAGECVSLSAVYAAAAFVICGVPLEDIYMVLTPLHSQNFIDINGGILTNNRRLVTKTMWFNGTAISNKAQRAIRNEQVTIVAHNTGWVHYMYNDATIKKENYDEFRNKLARYLSEELTLVSFASFLRSNRDYQKHFQLCRDCHGQPKFLKAEVLFHYEHGSNYKIADSAHEKLLGEVSEDDFVNYELPDRIRCDKLDEFIKTQKPDLKTKQGRKQVAKFLSPIIPAPNDFVDELADFFYIEPKLPASDKNYNHTDAIGIHPEQSREQIIAHLMKLRSSNITADLAFYAYRDMQTCNWQPFVKAAVERNPVSIEKAKAMSIEEIYNWLIAMPTESIYNGKRLAQPDEVANYKTGDGLEKAFLLVNLLHNKNPQQNIEIIVNNNEVLVEQASQYRFISGKGLQKKITITADKQIVV